MLFRFRNPFRTMMRPADNGQANPRSQRQSNLGIYDPPEPPLTVLPEDARERWEQVYAEAMEVYRRQEVAEATAWRTVRLSWRPVGNGQWVRCNNNRCVVWPQPKVLPRPRAVLVGQGVLIEYGYVDRSGVLHVIETDRHEPPILYWDKVGKSLYAFPKQHYPACNSVPSTPQYQEAVKTYRMWAKGKTPKCADNTPIPAVQIHAVGVSDTVSYRSDKFDGKDEKIVRVDLRGTPRVDPRVKDATEYIHKHWHDVWTWVDDPRDPSVIYIHGGALDVHAKGIIH
jgi:hypothetical protein